MGIKVQINRRSLLKAGLGVASSSWLLGCSSKLTSSSAELAGCSIRGVDDYAFTLADGSGQEIESFPLPARGHGVASSTHNHIAVFARRPGSFMQVIDVSSGKIVCLKLAANNRHYYGHGCYSADGRWLYATEGESQTSQGVIGVYDAHNGYTKVRELTNFGIGPHEVVMLPNGDLAIGVGGVQTRGRKPVNLETMKPALVYLTTDGKIKGQFELVDHKLSIRHLSIDSEGTVYCGQQYRGNPDDYPALIAAERSGGLSNLGGEEEDWARFNHYIASIASNDEFIVATSPRGNCYGVWYKNSLALKKIVSLPDASGVVVKGKRFFISSGVGRVVIESGEQSAVSEQYNVMWDNHWSRVF
ncbi:DUF1513 domain-containing protein [Vibrio maerlii]|uniref:DUF1513 domain-containing protein n=1 Tax=Vibrio maerlii TaxID=2231648 RepID=UPI000E3EC2E0|nr:DUF1513 domain-containing protein [Vibrio maerlii]